MAKPCLASEMGYVHLLRDSDISHPLQILGPNNGPARPLSNLAVAQTEVTNILVSGPIVRIAPNHLSFSSHSAQKVIYGFGTKAVPSMVKDPTFFTPEVDHSMNIINETDREEHSRMRRMLSFAFSTSNLLENEDVLVRRTNDFIQTLAEENQKARSKSKRGFNIVQQFNYVTFNIMGK
jgi:hypothetical protein